MEAVIHNPEGIPREVVEAAVRMMEEEEGRKVKELYIRRTENAGEYGITPVFETVPFQRLRRITGYLVHSMDQWNDAKRAEERDRVKHTV